LTAAATGIESPMVSAIIPARNEEATIARCVESLAPQSGLGEILVVNDQSSDFTAAILSAEAASIPTLKIIDAPPLPPGWMGKNFAVSVGAASAKSDWLLFTDADTFHFPGSVLHALDDAAKNQAALVSYSPEQEMHSFWERALIPVVYSRLAQKYPYQRVNDPNTRDAAANGQFLMVRRDAYEAVGGHAAIRMEVLEDVVLAGNLKHAGYRIYFAAGQGIVRTRMYRTFGAMWQGWTKNLYPLIGSSGRSVFRELELAFPWTAITLLLFSPVSRWFAAAGTVLLLAHIWHYGAQLRMNRFSLLLILYYVPGQLLYAAALIASAWKNTHGVIAWKGREYPAPMS
jgi:cellulose synthase/poly-beta-1,6-N-acetylglucosamine synthase-like glycosyltransferase